MAVFQVKKYKTIKDENGKKIQVPKTTEEWNKETRNNTMTWYFSARYEINGKKKQYKSALFALKREAIDDNALFLIDPIKYIMEHSKRAKNKLECTTESSIKEKTLEEYFTEFNDFKSYYIKGASVYEDKKNWFGHISEDFGCSTPNEITFEKVQNWHKKINKKINPKTGLPYSTKSKNKWHGTLSEFLNYLVSEGKIETNYAKAIGQFKNPNTNKNEIKKIKYQTIEKFNFFINEVYDEFWKTFFTFTFWHGCRIGEQRALKIKDINFDNNLIHFHSTFTKDKNGHENIGSIKNGKERTIYLDEHVKPLLIKLVKMYQQMDGYSDEWFLFGGPYNTYKNRIERKFKEYYDKLKERNPNETINSLTHHEFGRHSHASYLLDLGIKKGLPLEEIYSIIAQRLGDTVEVIKRTYAHPYDSQNNDKARELLKF